MAEPSLNRCLTCSKSYKHPEHLRRHQLSHSRERPFVCEQCDKSFQRTDSLKRHITTCDPDTPLESKSKKSARSNPINPSEPVFVSSREQEVTVPLLSATGYDLFPDGLDEPPFGHIVGWIAGGISSLPSGDPGDNFWHEFLNMNSGIQTPCLSTDAGSDDLKSLNILVNFTSKTGLISSFDCGTIDQRRQIATEFARSQQNFDLMMSYPNSTSAASSIVPFADTAEFEDYVKDSPERNLYNWLSDPLSLKSHEIINAIKEVATLMQNKGTNSLVWSPSMYELCVQFFSPDNLRKYLEFYWAIWHPNVNFMHKPTFSPLNSKPVLVAAMSLIGRPTYTQIYQKLNREGACVSPNNADVEGAKRWFNYVEEIVFNDPEYCDDTFTVFPGDTSDNEWRMGKIQGLQAAYIVCLIQTWEGSDKSKRRLRRHRYSSIVSTARDIGIDNARHPDYSQQDLGEFMWTSFVKREELIRVFLWIFLLDTAFVIFNNLPPRMVIREMKMDIAYPEACFQSTTSEACHKELQKNSSRQNLEFSVAVEMLYQDSVNVDLTVLADLGPLNLFAMISALHSEIFHYQNSLSYQGPLEPIRKALGNWQKIWDIYVTQFSSSLQHSPVASQNLSHFDMWKRVGFMRHASEYWLLANLVFQRLEESAETKTEGAASATSAESHPNKAGNTSINPLLEKVDETSVQQMNMLISGFKKWEFDSPGQLL